jgi:hypothetical protein
MSASALSRDPISRDSHRLDSSRGAGMVDTLYADIHDPSLSKPYHKNCSTGAMRGYDTVSSESDYEYMVSVRRYDKEFVLSVVVSAKYQGRQKDLERVVLPPEPTCNLYIVSKAPRLTADPGSVTLTSNGELFVTLREQVKDTFKEHHVHVKRFTPNTAGLIWHSEWPYDEFAILTSDGRRIFGGPVRTFFGSYELLPKPLVRHEIVYIGQAFGKTGERTAFDRLKNHSTLQRIYSEMRPDTEIWLTLCYVSDITLHTVMDKPGRPSYKTKIEDQEHLARVLSRYNSGDFWEREAVTGAEAGLINYFKPKYNIIFKDNYPDPAHVHISALYELELHTLVVELQSFPIYTDFRSASVQPSSLHFAHYPLGDVGELLSFWDR